MGNDARQRAWSYKGSQGERLLLLALAEYIPDGRHTCWPAIDTLAGMAGVGARQTQRLLRDLEENGAIVTAIGRGRKHTTTYGLLIGLSEDDQKGVILDIKGDISGTKGDIVVSPISFSKGDTTMSPFEEEKVTSGAQKVTFLNGKGDIAMSPEPKGTEIESIPKGESDPNYRGMFEAVARACQIDLKICTKGQRYQVAQVSKTLRSAGKLPEDIPKFEDWWYQFDWRGKKGEPPKPTQIQEQWQQATGIRQSNGKHLRSSTGQHSERGIISETDHDKPW